ncbi:MAG: hypothetical protein JXB10_08805 [Pirellulales bacterium]|nr:hypothetical protein [Pirellulales bacterium]
MSWLRTIVWLLVAGGGIGVTFRAYHEASERDGGERPNYILFVAQEPSARLSRGTPVGVRLLAPAEDVVQTAEVFGAANPSFKRSFLYNHQEKVVLAPDFGNRFTAKVLASGRLPAAGAEEVLAEASAHPPAEITAGRQVLKVVGVLRREDSPKLNAFYASDDPVLRRRLDSKKEPLGQGFLVPQEEAKEMLSSGDRFPRGQFTTVAEIQRLPRGPYHSYLAGMALLIFGGSALLIQAYGFAAQRITHSWLGPPLTELRQRWRLLALLHVAYFGLYFAAAMIIYEFPLVQDGMLMLVGQEVQGGSGPLGIAGQAYASRIIPLAAAATLGVNFIVGSLLMITVPSLIIPGLGVLTAWFRAIVWGLLLAPAVLSLAGAMRFHSLTLLLEGEGYVLAAFFAMLVPVWLFSPRAGRSVGARYGHALLMNLKGNLLVLIVLALAAVYEAVEVILQMG